MLQSIRLRTALGRAAHIGALYDVRTESFVHDSLFSSKVGEDSVATMELGDTSIELVTSERIQDKFSKLDIEAELQVSLLAGLVKLSGSGAYFNEEKRSTRTQSMSLVYKIRTVNEEIMIRHHKDKIDTSLLMGDGHPVATHVVVGIDYGAICSVTCECENSEGRDETTVKGALKAELDKLKGLISSANASARVEYKDEKREHEIKFTFKCKCDVSSSDKDLPVSFEGALEMAKSLPKLVSETNKGKGVPLLYMLMPLDVVAKVVQVSFEMQLATIREDTIKQSAQALEKLTVKSQRLFDIQRDLSAFGEYIEEERLAKIGDYVDDITVRIVQFKAQLLQHVTKVRRQEEDLSALDSFLAETVVDDSPLARYDGYIREFQRDINKVTLVKEWKKRGIHYLGKSDLLLHDDKDTAHIYYRPQEGTTSVHNKKNEDCFLRCQKTYSKQSDVVFKVVDESIRPDLWRGRRNKAAIEVYVKGRLTCFDYFEKEGKDTEMCLIKYKVSPLRHNKPSERAVAELRCPNSVAGNGQCSGNSITWKCAKCEEPVEYGLKTKKFYCKCGESEPTSAVFRCNEHVHGIDFIDYPDDLLRDELGTLRAMREQNILILGETGVGKSTWINGIVNYLFFANLNEAKDADDFRVLIPSQFTFTNHGKSEVVKVGKGSENEILQAGHSATQETRSYVFILGETKLRLIDTPGIGDSRGMEQDRKNFDNILAYLSFYDEIHAVCILLKPNNSRLTAMFRFCIQELLAHLHTSAKENIVFCFTNARATFYQPGDTLPALNKMLKDKQIGITANPNNYFCFDNEPLRFLACLHTGIEFSQDDIDTYATSWDKAVTVTRSLFEHINSLPPHSVRNTLSMNEARRVIVAMSKPMAEVAKTIQENVQNADVAKEQIDLQKRGMAHLEKTLRFMGIDLIRTELDYPITVCTDTDCVQMVSTGQENTHRIVYKQVCHKHCYLSGIPTETVNDSRLQGCWCIEGANCHLCGHHYLKHMHLTYTMEQVSKEFISDEVKSQIMAKETEKGKKEEFKSRVDQKIRELEDEEKTILQVSAKYGAFLKANAIIPYNDAVGDYLDMIIEHEETKASEIRNKGLLQNLQRMRAEYENEKHILDSAIATPTVTNIPEEVIQLQNELFALKHFGQTLQNLFKGISVANSSRGFHFKEVMAPVNEQSHNWFTITYMCNKAKTSYHKVSNKTKTFLGLQ